MVKGEERVYGTTHSESVSSAAGAGLGSSSMVTPLSAVVMESVGVFIKMLLLSVPERRPSLDPSDGLLYGTVGVGGL